MVLVAVLAINGGAWLLERALMAPVNAYIRDRTLAFLQEKSVEGLLITFPRLDLSLVRRQVLIHDLSIRYDNKDSTRYVRFQANVPRITLEGVDLGDVIWHRHLRLDVVRLSKPVVSRCDLSLIARFFQPAGTARGRGSTGAPGSRSGSRTRSRPVSG